MVAERIVQLDHMTMGRAMFGFGPGLLPTDATMLGVDIKAQRDLLAQALEVVLRLLNGEEVTESSMIAAALRAGGAATHGAMALKFYDQV